MRSPIIIIYIYIYNTLTYTTRVMSLIVLCFSLLEYIYIYIYILEEKDRSILFNQMKNQQQQNKKCLMEYPLSRLTLLAKL